MNLHLAFGYNIRSATNTLVLLWYYYGHDECSMVMLRMVLRRIDGVARGTIAHPEMGRGADDSPGESVRWRVLVHDGDCVWRNKGLPFDWFKWRLGVYPANALLATTGA